MHSWSLPSRAVSVPLPGNALLENLNRAVVVVVAVHNAGTGDVPGDLARNTLECRQRRLGPSVLCPCTDLHLQVYKSLNPSC